MSQSTFIIETLKLSNKLKIIQLRTIKKQPLKLKKVQLKEKSQIFLTKCSIELKFHSDLMIFILICIKTASFPLFDIKGFII